MTDQIADYRQQGVACTSLCSLMRRERGIHSRPNPYCKAKKWHLKLTWPSFIFWQWVNGLYRGRRRAITKWKAWSF
jgi:hypothetical protein